jgi:hypothetical protein
VWGRGVITIDSMRFGQSLERWSSEVPSRLTIIVRPEWETTIRCIHERLLFIIKKEDELNETLDMLKEAV